MDRVGVAISTTGHDHRMGFLETCVKSWDVALPQHASLFVTVDGTEQDAERVREVVGEWTGSVFRVGQPHPDECTDDGRMGVAVNKNTGLELLMDNTRSEHLFLCDDDTWPLYGASLDKHIGMRSPHSMVCWGQSRLKDVVREEAYWTWPRGVLLYVTREVVDRVGGMDERFGGGGHEHAEWSQRIHNAGFTAEPFVSPASYATRTGKGARALWHAEDMRQPGESPEVQSKRKKHQTTIIRTGKDWMRIRQVMADREGSSDFVPFRANENGRGSATLSSNLSGQGDCAVEPVSRGSEK